MRRYALAAAAVVAAVSTCSPSGVAVGPAAISTVGVLASEDVVGQTASFVLDDGRTWSSPIDRFSVVYRAGGGPMLFVVARAASGDFVAMAGGWSRLPEGCVFAIHDTAAVSGDHVNLKRIDFQVSARAAATGGLTAVDQPRAFCLDRHAIVVDIVVWPQG